MSKNSLQWALSAVLVALVAGALVFGLGDRSPEDPPWWSGETGECTEAVTRAHLDSAVALGRGFLLHNQHERGNFTYEFDWRKQEYSVGDNQVRQAGASWGLSLVYQDQPDPEVRAALLKSHDFWKANSHVSEDGRRWVTYLDEERGQLGTVALVALSIIETLRAEDPDLPEERRAELREHLDGYLRFLVGAQAPDKRFHASFVVTNGRYIGAPSPYADGETLLALVKAARYLGREDLKPLIFEAADAGIALNVTAPRAADPDPDTTKGYYQWASMSWHELSTAGWSEDTRKYEDQLIELADWMIDTHRTLARNKNTAYAYEGIVSAYDMAVRHGDAHHMKKFDCVINRGLRRLSSWQLGHPLASRFVRTAPDDERSRGGVQNAENEPGLRIDVTQHQTHAILLARRHWRKE